MFKKVGTYARTDVDDYIGGDVSPVVQLIERVQTNTNTNTIRNTNTKINMDDYIGGDVSLVAHLAGGWHWVPTHPCYQCTVASPIGRRFV